MNLASSREAGILLHTRVSTGTTISIIIFSKPHYTHWKPFQN